MSKRQRSYMVEEELYRNFKYVCVHKGKLMSEITSELIDKFVQNHMYLIHGRKTISDY